MLSSKRHLNTLQYSCHKCTIPVEVCGSKRHHTTVCTCVFVCRIWIILLYSQLSFCVFWTLHVWWMISGTRSMRWNSTLWSKRWRIKYVRELYLNISIGIKLGYYILIILLLATVPILNKCTNINSTDSLCSPDSEVDTGYKFVLRVTIDHRPWSH